MNDKFKLFKQIIRESNYDNTYKMAWAKSLVELSTELNLDEELVKVDFEQIAKKYIKYYWNQDIFFRLNQGSNLKKEPVILQSVRSLIGKYYIVAASSLPILFEKIEDCFEDFGLQGEYNKIVKKVVATLKADVSWRFTYLNGKHIDIYYYNKGDDYLMIESSLLKDLKENEVDLYDLINYRWGLILEIFNSSPRINKKVKIMDEREIKRNSLKKFTEFLDLENPGHKCFICEGEIDDENVSIDHVIPWSYMYSDDLWNLVYVCKSCNSSKSNRIPSEDEVLKLKSRNIQLLKSMEDESIKSKALDELRLAIDRDYVNKFWIGCKS